MRDRRMLGAALLAGGLLCAAPVATTAKTAPPPPSSTSTCQARFGTSTQVATAKKVTSSTSCVAAVPAVVAALAWTYDSGYSSHTFIGTLSGSGYAPNSALTWVTAGVWVYDGPTVTSAVTDIFGNPVVTDAGGNFHIDTIIFECATGSIVITDASGNSATAPHPPSCYP